MGKYDDPDDPGDVSHFQALTTALSATVGIGNIAGVAIAIHFGGPGAIFWMWVTAMFGMATKYTEVTLAQQYREISPGSDGSKGTISGGPMYYIEKGLGKKWKPMAAFVAFGIMLTAFLSGNAIQANSIADLFNSEFNIPMWMSGLGTAAFVGLVILGGIQRIGKVTSVIAPIMALLYVVGGITVLVINADMVWPAFRSIFVEAFNPSAGIAGTGAGLFIQTLLWGVRRGLFSNEAGQGSAPIAHSAAKTKDPSSEGVVALLEPFIDTIIICTFTSLIILTVQIELDGVTQSTWMFGDNGGANRGAILTSEAFAAGVPFGGYVVIIGQLVFSFTTIIAWALYVERAGVFLSNEKFAMPFRISSVIVVFLGCVGSFQTIWAFGLATLGILAAPNLIALLIKSPEIFAMTREAHEQRKQMEKQENN